MKEELYLDELREIEPSRIDLLLDTLGVETAGSRIRFQKAAVKLIEQSSFPKLPKKRIKEPKVMPIPNKKIDAVWKIEHKDLEYTKRLGSGASGKVYKGLFNGMKVAVKVLKTGNEQENQKILHEFDKEFGVMSVMKSPYIVGFFGACVEPKICMVMEYCSRGSLYSVLSNPNEEISWERGFKFINEILEGIKALHTFKPPIYHRDLKSLNILVTEDWTIKITDFGLARFNTAENMQTFTNVVGTIGYSAPEVLSGSGFIDRSDIWSLAMILYEIIYKVTTGVYRRPYEEYGSIAEYLVVAKVVENNLTPTLPFPCNSDLQNLIQSCWNKEPAQRPAITSALLEPSDNANPQLLEKMNAIFEIYSQDPVQWQERYTAKEKK